MPMRMTRSAAFRGLPELIKELGGDVDVLVKAIGIAPEALTDDTWAPASQVYQLLNLAARQLRRRDLGLLWGERTHPSMLGPLYVAMAHAETGHDAIRLAGRFIQTQNQLVRVTMAPRAEGVAAIVANLQGNKRDLVLLSERQIAFMHRLFAEIFGPRYEAAAVLFDHEQQAEDERYIAVFGKLPQFDAGCSGLVLSHDLLARPIPNSQPQMREMALHYLSTLSRAGDATFVDQVSDVVRALLASADCEAGDAARVLGMEVRTMQRRLFAEDASFEQVKDQVRRDLAEQWLAQPEIPLTQVSAMLQYANASAFTRSCKRWFGAAPREQRARLAESA